MSVREILYQTPSFYNLSIRFHGHFYDLMQELDFNKFKAYNIKHD
jgi:hypothetical protein